MNQKKIVTFDCYGTLIRFDLDSAVRAIVGPRAAKWGIDIEVLLADLRVIRFAAVVGPYRRYQDILRDTLEIGCLRHGVPYDAEFGNRLVEVVKNFIPFPDVTAALRDLQGLGYQIALLTNSDEDLISHHVKAMEVDFDYVVTAEVARAYKPRPQAFEALFRVVDRPRELITHAAQGWEYDMLPTKEFGVRRVWVNRASLRGNERFAPYDEVSDLRGLVQLLSES